MAKILICDDSVFIRERIKEILKSEGHEIVGEAKNGQEAVQKFDEVSPDLVTMDILMDIGGVEAIKCIRAVHPNAKIVIVSILENQQEEIVEGVKSGASGYVGKPIKRELLLGEVERVLGQ